MSAITQYFDQKKDARLLIRSGELECVSKSQIGLWTRFKAWCGFGPASLKNVCAFIAKNPQKFFKQPLDPLSAQKWERFRTLIERYNKKHLFWKRIKNLSKVFQGHVLPEPKAGLPLLEKVWKEYSKSIDPHKRTASLATRMIPLHLDHMVPNKSYIDVDQGEANIVRELASNAQVAFYPLEFKSPERDAQEFAHLCKFMDEAFRAGKSYFVVRLRDHDHAVAAAFRYDGKFKIIDSVKNSTIDIKTLGDKLNGAAIADSKGKPIQFRSEYVNTHLQKADNCCEKYATLYACQMAKTGHFNGYKQVNAAFANRQLNRFEDYQQIARNGSLKDAGKLDRERTRPFLESWIFRSLHLPANRWQDLKVKDISKIGVFPTMLDFFRFQPGEAVYASGHTDLETKPEIIPGSRQWILVDLQGQQRPLPQDRLIRMEENFEQSTFGELVPTSKDEIRLLIRSGKGEMWWIRLFKGERLFQEATKKDGQKTHTRDFTAIS